MHRYKHIAFFTLFFVGLFSLFSINISAQKGETSVSNLTDKVLQNYINISSLTREERIAYFNDKLTAEDRANIFKFHLAFQFVKRPNLNKEQKDLILESISMITPDSYDEKKPQKRTDAQKQANVLGQKAMILFTKQEVYEIFASLGGSQEDSEILQKFQSINNLVTKAEVFKIYDNYSPEEKSNFWKIRFAISLIRDFNIEQKKLIVEAINSVSPNLYINKTLGELETKRANLTSLIERVSSAFPNEAGIPIFTIVGRDEVDSMNLLPRCHCLRDSWFSGCGVSSKCEGGTCNDNSNNGTHCGFGGLWSCDGRCVAN